MRRKAPGQAGRDDLREQPDRGRHGLPDPAGTGGVPSPGSGTPSTTGVHYGLWQDDAMNDDEIARRAADAAQSAADAAWVSAYSALATAVLSLLLVLGAYLAWRVAKATLDQSKAANRQMELDSIEQTRPYVYARIVPSIGGNAAWDLIVRNSGRSSATNLTIKASDWPEDDAVTAALRKMFEHPQILPPDTSIRTYWSLGPRDAPGSTGATGFDIPVDITVTYSGPDSRTYTETFHLDPETLGLTPNAAAGVDIVKPTEELKKMREIVQALNELRRGQ